MRLESGAFALERRRFGDRGDRMESKLYGGAHHAALLKH